MGLFARPRHNDVGATHRRRRGLGGSDRARRQAVRSRLPPQGLHARRADLLRRQRRAPGRPLGRQGGRDQVLRRHRHLLPAPAHRGAAGPQWRTARPPAGQRPRRPGRGEHHASQPPRGRDRPPRDLRLGGHAESPRRRGHPAPAEGCAQGHIRHRCGAGGEPGSDGRRLPLLDGGRAGRGGSGPAAGGGQHLPDPGGEVHGGHGDARAGGGAGRSRACRL